MAPHKITPDFNDQENEIQIRNLEPLLKESLKDNKVQVVDYKATRLVPPGENYCSIIIKLDVRIRKGTSEKTLHLVAKTPSPSEGAVIEWPLIFKKELFMYQELRPLYRELEKEAGIEEHELINVWPGYVGYRNSLKNDEKIDNDSMLLMENIKTQGFYVMDRKKGLDVHHAKKALSSLARYHALGIIMNHRRPSFAKKVVEQAQVLGLDFDMIDQGLDSLFKTMLETPCLQKYSAILKSSFEYAKGGKCYKEVTSEEWTSITHGDFWVNNMLFHKDEAGNLDDVKFVDFQMYLYNSALKDLPYFLCGSLDANTQANHVHELIDTYYNSFIETLNRMNCDISKFTKESFECELKKQARYQMPNSVLAMKFFVFEVDRDSDNEKLMDTIFDAQVSDAFADKLKNFTKMYERMGWFY